MNHASAWKMATSEDYRYLTTEGGQPDYVTHLFHCYFDRVIELATESTVVRQTFLEVQHMLRKPKALFRPGIIGRMLWLAARKAAGRLNFPSLFPWRTVEVGKHARATQFD